MMQKLMNRTLALALILTPAVMVAQATPEAPAAPVSPAAPAAPAMPASPAAPAASAAQVAGFDGTWQVVGDVAGNPVTSTCILTTTEGSVKGTC
ncbi:MAG: hypothetical protein ABI197_12665, partial [Granulicella sp.]